MGKIEAFGVPFKLIRTLKSTGKLMLDGREVLLEDVSSLPSKPRRLLVLGDTMDSSSVLPVCDSCDVIIHESTYDASMREVAISRGHSTSTMAAEFAKQLHVRHLILTHISARYSEQACGILVEEAAKVLGKFISYISCVQALGQGSDAHVHVASDFWEFDFSDRF